MPAGQRLDHVLQPRRVAQRQHMAVTGGVERLAVPVGHHAPGPLHHRHQRRPVVQFQVRLADHIKLPARQHGVVVAIAAHHHPLVVGARGQRHEMLALMVVEIVRASGGKAGIGQLPAGPRADRLAVEQRRLPGHAHPALAGNRLVDHAKGFPAVKKTYLANTVAIVLVLGDPRWKSCFPQATSAEWDVEYRANNEAIFLCSLGAAIQNIQLGVAAEGLTSAWLSGGGEDATNRELSNLLGYPSWMKAYGVVPIGYPAIDQSSRYRRPLEQVLHWNKYEPRQYRRHDQVDYYGKLTSRADVLKDKERYVARWPVRSYRLRSETIRASCDEGKSTCRIEGLLDFDLSNPADGRKSSGASSFEFGIRFSRDSGRIFHESGKILAAQKKK